MLAESLGEADRTADVFGVLRTDVRVGMQGVSVAVQPGDGNPRALEDTEVVVARGVTDKDLVEGRDVYRRQEPSGVDLDAGQADVGDCHNGFGQRSVVE